MLRRTFLTLALALSISLPAMAAEKANGARDLIEGMAQQAITVLGAKDRTDADIKAKFHDLLVGGFDVPTIGRFVLGRAWRDATPAQQTEYLSLFENYVVGIYANRFKEYSGETLEITGQKDVDDATVVSSRINRPNGAPAVAVDWKIKQGEDGIWRVQDVIIEQVSMSISQRSEFASVIQNGGGKLEALLAQLRARTNSSASSTASKAKAG